MDNRPRYRVPDELRETLLDFTIAYLLERPPNLIDFGITFFQRLKGDRDGGRSASTGAGARSGGGRNSQDMNGRDENDEDEGETLEQLSFPDDNPPELVDGGVVSKAEFRDKITTEHALDIAKIGAGDVCSLGENEATWIWHMAARYVLEKPKDIVEWGLQYCENEKGRWAYN